MRIDVRTDALLVIDMQLDLLPGGALAVPRGNEIVAPVAQLARRFGTVVATQDFHPAGHVSFASSHPGRKPLDVIAVPGGRKQVLWPDHCVAGTWGARICPELPDDRLTLIMRKGMRLEVDSESAFRDQPDPQANRPSTGLGAWLRARGVARIFLAGLARDLCVRASAVDSAAEGFETIVLDDLTRPVFPEKCVETDQYWARAHVCIGLSGDLG